MHKNDSLVNDGCFVVSLGVNFIQEKSFKIVFEFQDANVFSKIDDRCKQGRTEKVVRDGANLKARKNVFLVKLKPHEKGGGRRPQLCTPMDVTHIKQVRNIQH